MDPRDHTDGEPTLKRIGNWGKFLQIKRNAATGPLAFLIPLRGVSMLDGDGERFCDREADQAFIKSLRENLAPDVPVIEVDANINDEQFAKNAVETLLQLLNEK